MNGEAKMFLMGLGALLVFGGVLYMARATIWRGSLSGLLATLWSRRRAAWASWDLERTGRGFS